MEKSSSQKSYSKFYINADMHFITRSDEMIRSRLGWLRFSSNKRVLDVACGISQLCKTFSHNVYGLEMNKEAVRIARKNGIKVKLADVEHKWEFPDEYFDIVYANHIIEHLLNPDGLMSEANRVLKNKGLLIIGTPNLAAWFNRLLLLFGVQPFFTEVSTIDKTLGLNFTRHFTSLRNPMGHLRIFTLGSLCELLALHGFKPIKTYGIEFLSLPKPLLAIDRIISQHSVSLASNIMVVAKKI